jgi:hypothetical protein
MSRVQKVLLTIAGILIAILILRGFESRIWHMKHGDWVTIGRLTMKLNDNWMIMPDDYGRPLVIRPPWTPFKASSGGELMIFQPNLCMSGDTSLEGLHTTYPIDQIFTTTREDVKTGFRHTSCSLSRSKFNKFYFLDCAIHDDGTSFSISGPSSVVEEAESMIPSVRLTQACTPLR